PCVRHQPPLRAHIYVRHLGGRSSGGHRFVTVTFLRASLCANGHSPLSSDQGPTPITNPLLVDPHT
ncbi:hypothetical protein, partial [Mycobacteroides abscessus]|uniref:hypothetical protein n=1 Tax=Mycobacteroides abscessus TaxID=36809 RepID=UPI001C26082C